MNEEKIEYSINIAIAVCFIVGVFYFMYRDLHN